MSLSSLQFRKAAVLAAQSADAKKAEEVLLLDLRRVRGAVSDFLLLMTANSTTHLRTLRDAVEESLGRSGLRPLHRDGAYSARWAALDYGGVLVHIFDAEARGYYSLERLWAEAKPVPWQPEESGTSARKNRPAKVRR